MIFLTGLVPWLKSTSNAFFFRGTDLQQTDELAQIEQKYIWGRKVNE